MMAEKTCVKVLVEENGEHGFDSYRVPGIVTASNGDLLLTYEAGSRRKPQDSILQEISDKGWKAAVLQESGSQWYRRKGKNFFIIPC